MFKIKSVLAQFVLQVSPLRCACVTVSDLAVIDMGSQSKRVFESFAEIKRRGDPFWWLSAHRCKVCGQPWLVAQEERINDVYCLRRLNAEEAELLIRHNRWPPDFDKFESLLRLSKEAGKRVRFLDPQDPALLQTVVDLANERPGIRVSEIAELLNLESRQALRLSKSAVREATVRIALDA